MPVDLVRCPHDFKELQEAGDINKQKKVVNKIME